MNQPTYSHRRIHPLYLFFAGLCMGAADVVPGVSGGTMAFVLGVYAQLLAAVESFNLDLVRKLLKRQWREAFAAIPWAFLIPLGLGIATALVTLADLLSYWLENDKTLLFAFFFGLILASIIALAGRHVWTKSAILSAVIGTFVAYLIVGLVPADPGHSKPILFGSGAIAICAMILPGISGSFILLILGQYEHCVNALKAMIDSARQLDVGAFVGVIWETVLPVGLGAVVGLLAFTRILSWLLARYYAATVALLIGFMIGSLRRIWPYKEELEFGTDRHGDPILLKWKNTLPDIDDSSLLLAILLCVAGFVLLSVLDHIYDRKNPVICLLTRRRPEPSAGE